MQMPGILHFSRRVARSLNIVAHAFSLTRMARTPVKHIPSSQNSGGGPIGNSTRTLGLPLVILARTDPPIPTMTWFALSFTSAAGTTSTRTVPALSVGTVKAITMLDDSEPRLLKTDRSGAREMTISCSVVTMGTDCANSIKHMLPVRFWGTHHRPSVA